jgi:hypothetical protein
VADAFADGIFESYSDIEVFRPFELTKEVIVVAQNQDKRRRRAEPSYEQLRLPQPAGNELIHAYSEQHVVSRFLVRDR